jgi:general secretion pathway protein G
VSCGQKFARALASDVEARGSRTARERRSAARRSQTNRIELMRRHTRARARGLSLIEILVVLAIIAMISGVVAITVVSHLDKARKETTRQSALALRSIASTYRMDRAGEECPTVEMLVAANAIDEASKKLDAWDRPFEIQCDDHGGIRVASGGPDKQLGTEDDIRAP